ncbi:MAG TPA: hypothetical protein VGS17_07150 [Candidatus Limnocylindria bacterium]|nr:hypothetical protein [Candidatus Limnocylindria bacterium]
MTTRGSLAFVGAFTAYWLVALPLDSLSTAGQQLLLSASAWLFLAVALALQAPAVRLQVITLVCVATLLEVIGSLVWGAYRYRLGNLPLFVPAGHGLFYLAALRAASVPLLQRRARRVVVAVTIAATAYMLWGLVRSPLPDLLGFVTWAVFVRFIVRGRFPLLYAVSFVLTLALELYGTGWGIWHWAPVLPGLILPAGNPPTGIGAGYAAMDGLTRRIVGLIARVRRSRQPWRTPPRERALRQACGLRWLSHSRTNPNAAMAPPMTTQSGSSTIELRAPRIRPRPWPAKVSPTRMSTTATAVARNRPVSAARHPSSSGAGRARA